MKKVTHTLSIVNTSVIGLALSATFVTGFDSLTLIEEKAKREHEIQVATNKSESSNDSYYRGFEKESLNLIRKIKEKAAEQLEATEAAKKDDFYDRDSLIYKEQAVYNAQDEYRKFTLKLGKIRRDDPGKSSAFDELITLACQNDNYLRALGYKNDFVGFKSISTKPVSFGQSKYSFSVIEAPTQQ